MQKVEQFEILVLGSGEVGKYLAWTMTKEGHRTALVGRRWLGGSCPNFACLPSKNLIYSILVASLARRGGEFRIKMDALRVDMTHVQRRKLETVDGLHQMHAERFTASGVDLMMGDGRFIAPKQLKLPQRQCQKNCRRARVPGPRFARDAAKVPGLASAKPMTHIAATERAEMIAARVILDGIRRSG